MKRAAALLMLALAQCSDAPEDASSRGAPAPALERAAIEAGVIPDPAADLTGLYLRDTDRLCLVPAPGGHKAGVTVDYGAGLGCSAAGTARRDGNAVRFDFGRGCTVEASYDGSRLAFPAALPDACASACTPRASLGALAVERVSDTASEARTMRDGRGRLLCG